MFLDLRLNNYSAGHLPSRADDKEHFLNREKKKLIEVENYLLDEDNILDANKIQQEIFPLISADVFISHSHRDKDGAIEIALTLEEMGLTAFVDSCVWGYADELLRKVDDEFCIPEGWSSYSYSLRNRTTTNVHMILNSALQGMIDKSELLIFLDSENSVKVTEYVNKKEFLSSPWIHSELMFANRVRRSARKKLSFSNESFDLRKSQASTDVEFVYEVPKMTHSIEFRDFANWMKDFSKFQRSNRNAPKGVLGLEHLDRLYKTLGVSDKLLSDPRWTGD